MAVPFTRGIGIIKMKTVVLLGFGIIGLLLRVSTLIMRRRMFPSTILLMGSTLDCPLITAQSIGSRLLLI